MTSHLTDVATESGQLAYASIGSDADVFDQVNALAESWAATESSQLVSNISETTRSMLQRTIAGGIDAGLTVDEIAALIEDSGAFSAQRARLIAETEVAAANSHGALAGYQAARDSGVSVKKEWLLGGNPCDACQENADAGAIDLDDEFPSSDDAPPGHPGCQCALSPVVEDGDSLQPNGD